MIKQYIRFESPSGQKVERTLYFDLNEFEVQHDMELEVLKERLQKFQDEVINDTIERELTQPEKREMLSIIKELVKHSYGVRELGPDGEEFNKDEPHGSGDIWRRFVATGAFNAFILYLFEDTDRANKFMRSIWPKTIREAYEKGLEQAGAGPDLSVVPDLEPTSTNVGQEAPVYPGDDGVMSIASLDEPDQLASSHKKNWSDYMDEELLQMDRNEFNTLFAEARQGKNVPQRLLVISQKRKMAEGAEEPGGTTE